VNAGGGSLLPRRLSKNLCSKTTGAVCKRLSIATPVTDSLLSLPALPPPTSLFSSPYDHQNLVFASCRCLRFFVNPLSLFFRPAKGLLQQLALFASSSGEVGVPIRPLCKQSFKGCVGLADVCYFSPSPKLSPSPPSISLPPCFSDREDLLISGCGI
jgi:hypothetical protein